MLKPSAVLNFTISNQCDRERNDAGFQNFKRKKNSKSVSCDSSEKS